MTEPLLVRAARREPVEHTPVWFMRQAGRSLPEYRKIRERYGLFDVVERPELCAEVTLQPVHRHDVDAAVMFADIMLPLIGMGVPFSIDPGIGPLIHTPIRAAADIAGLRVVDPREATPELFSAIRLVRRQLDGKTAVVGFAGAPFTVASYMIEGKPTKEFSLTKAMLYGEPELWHRLMSTLTEVTIAYLEAQVEAGAQMVQLFDSWAGALSVSVYKESVLPYSRRILEAVSRTGVPTILFGTTTAHLLEAMASSGADVISVDWRLSLDAAWRRIGDRAIQGNLDPGVMLAPFPVIAREAREILGLAGGRPGHIFNLGHGVLPDTPSDHLKRLAELVHEETAGA